MVFFEDLTGKYFYNLTYKLHFFTYWSSNAVQTSVFFHNDSAIIDMSRMLSYAVCYKKNKQHNGKICRIFSTT